MRRKGNYVAGWYMDKQQIFIEIAKMMKITCWIGQTQWALTNNIYSVSSHERLSSCEPDLSDTFANKELCQVNNFVSCEQVSTCSEVHSFFWHAILTYSSADSEQLTRNTATQLSGAMTSMSSLA